jgi:hypothetical protein
MQVSEAHFSNLVIGRKPHRAIHAISRTINEYYAFAAFRCRLSWRSNTVVYSRLTAILGSQGNESNCQFWKN